MSDLVYERWMEPKEEPSSRDEFVKQYMLGEWPVNDAVYSREEVGKMVDRGDISLQRADELLHLRWEVNRKGKKVVEEK